MAYLTKDQLAARVGGADRLQECIHDAGATTDQDNEVLSQLLADVDAEADGYLRAGGYAIPLPDALLPQVKNALLDLANYYAKTRGNREASDDDRARWKAALARFDDIASRDIVLLTDAPSSSADLYSIDSEKGMFSRHRMGAW